MIIGFQFNIYHYEYVQNLVAATNFTSFSGALAWLESVGYLLIFLAMIVEGPVVTAAAAFASALGYFNIFIVITLSLLGDLVGDFAYYFAGYFGRITFVEKYGHKVGLTPQRIERMERLIKKHPKKTLAAIKLAPILPAPGLMIIGATKMPVGKYTWMTLIVTLPKTLIFVVLGYYFGRAYDSLAHYIESGQYLILLGVVVVVAALFIYKRVAARVSLRLETA